MYLLLLFMTTITIDTLPDFLARISYLIKVDGQVICDIKNPMKDDDFLVDLRRSQESDPRTVIRNHMEQHPDRFAALITE